MELAGPCPQHVFKTHIYVCFYIATGDEIACSVSKSENKKCDNDISYIGVGLYNAIGKFNY